MLYERWRDIASERVEEIALRDLASGKCWTFQQLRAAAESGLCEAGPIVCPRGHSPEFIFTLLRAWRSAQVVCPLEADQPRPQVPVPPRPCVHLKSTSATTGAPRWVAFTAAQLQADADNIVATMGLRPDWPNLGVISMAHSYGFSNLVLPLLLHGIPLILAPSSLPEAIRCGTENEPALTLPAVPALWRAWHEARAIPTGVRLAISAGAPLPAALEQAVFETRGLKIHNFYGATECGGIAYDTSDAPRTDDACVGSALRNVALSLNEDSCLTVGGGAVGETYWPDPAHALGAGRFQTSDLVEIKSGSVFLLGRLSDQINVAGRKVSPATIEQSLTQHPSVRGCLVFGVPDQDADRNEIIVACVVVAKPVLAGEFRQFLLDRLPAWQVPREWSFVESLSENRRGKISRVEWRRRYLEAKERKTQTPGSCA
jgi:long-chain acyl-CoA synthetase